MNTQIRIALAQINTIVGDFEANFAMVVEHIVRAERMGVDILLFPELTTSGYPPEDLLLKPQFIADNRASLDKIAQRNNKITTIVGFIDQADKIYNGAAILQGGKIVEIYHKICLPNYSVFDEKRYFSPGNQALVFEYDEIKFGLNICEDTWVADGVTECQGIIGGAEIILSLSASPYSVGKRNGRLAMGMERARTACTILAYLNLVGGQDELVFDGNSFIVDHRGEVLAEGRQFAEDLIVTDLDVADLRRFRQTDPAYHRGRREYKSQYDVRFVSLDSPPKGASKPVLRENSFRPMSRWQEIYRALVFGTRDYATKNGFTKVVLGLSGGIDSALTAAIAVEALGAQNVVGILMPSDYTSQQSITDAEKLASHLGIETRTIAIKETMQAYLATLAPEFNGSEPDTTEENLQARIRGNILMALSNKFGWLVLTTGNKSEMSVGYATLYGDMAGGFAVLKDVLKTWVYELCSYINSIDDSEIIPQSIITKAPTAELKPGQKDEDSLPPYEVLDAILAAFVEQEMSIEAIIAQGFPPEIVRKTVRLVDANEYKRRQAPPGIRVTPKAFGKDRRMPITHRYAR